MLDAPKARIFLQTCYSRCEAGAVAGQPAPVLEESGSLCLLYLLLATGYRTRSAPPLETEAGILDAMLPGNLKYAEAYFELARSVLTRLRGNEEPKLWTIQAWALMATYSISISEWNAADGYIGMSIFMDTRNS